MHNGCCPGKPFRERLYIKVVDQRYVDGLVRRRAAEAVGQGIQVVPVIVRKVQILHKLGVHGLF